LFLLVCTASYAAGSGGVNAPDQRNKPYLILVSIDGFRWDYPGLQVTPTLDRIAANGIKAEEMIPVFPTLTFPNHYSIATGLYPANHGLIDNRFPGKDRTKFYSLYDRESVQDGAWYRGEPVWVAAEKSGMVTAAYFFVGTEAAIDDVPMTYWNGFDSKIPGADRVEQVLAWLSLEASRRPHFITLYFEDVDVATHKFGPGSPQGVASIERVDGYLDQLLSGINELPVANDVYVVIVSDHGQSVVKQGDGPFIINTVVNLDGLTVVDHGAVSFIYFPKPDQGLAEKIRNAINESWKHGSAMLRSEVPENWNANEAAGFADVIVQADPGFTVYSSLARSSHTSTGDHGWAPEFRDMHGIFMASGPRLPKGVKIPPVEVIDVYPLLMEILELPIMTEIDGDQDLLPGLLKPRRGSE
jgi:predicted AlkP superfamily pyrophosphatase or phosphodiesterase